MRTHDTEFEEFARVAAERLRANAFMMCRDWHLAQDLTQTALTKLYVNWRKATQAENTFSYAQKVLFRTYLDHRRRRSSTETVDGDVRETAGDDGVDLRLTLLEALGRRPRRDRAIVILRYFEDYTVEQTAQLLDLSESVVKTQTRR